MVGLNELDEQAKARRQIGLPDAYQPLRGLGFGQCRLMIAVPDEWEWRGVEQLAGKRIATSYPAILAAWLKDKNVDAQVVELSGSVEIAPKLGTAELICDLVSSGATLAANQLKPVETLLDSEAVLAGPVHALDDARHETARLLLARCLQHETDHLGGTVFGDRLSTRARRLLSKQHEELAHLYPDDWPVTPRRTSAG